MNKLLFTLQRDFNDDIILIANNHKDLEDYLKANYNWWKMVITEDSIIVIEQNGDSSLYGSLEWIKHI